MVIQEYETMNRQNMFWIIKKNHPSCFTMDDILNNTEVIF